MDDNEDVRSASVNYIHTRYSIPSHKQSFSSAGHADPRHHRTFYKYPENYPLAIKPRPLRYPTTELHRYIRGKGRRHFYKPCNCCNNHKFFRSKSALSNEQYRRYWQSQLWNNQVCYYYQVLVLVGFCPTLQLASGLYGGDYSNPMQLYYTGSEVEASGEEGGHNLIDEVVDDNVIDPDEDIMDPDNVSHDPTLSNQLEIDSVEDDGHSQDRNNQDQESADDVIIQEDVVQNIHEAGANVDQSIHTSSNEDQACLEHERLRQENETTTISDVTPNIVNDSRNISSDTNSQDSVESSEYSSNSSVGFEVIDMSYDDEEVPSLCFYPAWKSSSVSLVNNNKQTSHEHHSMIIDQDTTHSCSHSRNDPVLRTRKNPVGNNTSDISSFSHNDTGLMEQHDIQHMPQIIQSVQEDDPGLSNVCIPDGEIRPIEDDRLENDIIRSKDHCGPTIRLPSASEMDSGTWQRPARFNDGYSMARHYQKQWACSRCDSTLLMRTSRDRETTGRQQGHAQAHGTDATYPRQGQFQRRIVEETQSTVEQKAPDLSRSDSVSSSLISERDVDLEEGVISSTYSPVSYQCSESAESSSSDQSIVDAPLVSIDSRHQFRVRTAPIERWSSLSFERPYTVQEDLDELRQKLCRWNSKFSFLDDDDDDDASHSTELSISSFELPLSEDDQDLEEEDSEGEEDYQHTPSTSGINEDEHRTRTDVKDSVPLIMKHRCPDVEIDTSLCRKSRGLEVFYEELASLAQQTRQTYTLAERLRQIRIEDGKELRMHRTLIEDMYVNWENMPHLSENLVAYTRANAMKARKRLSDLRTKVQDRLAQCLSPESYTTRRSKY